MMEVRRNERRWVKAQGQKWEGLHRGKGLGLLELRLWRFRALARLLLARDDAVELVKLGCVGAGLLQDLHLAQENVVQRVDALKKTRNNSNK